MGKAAHVRLFSGTIANRDPVPLQGRESVEKVTQIRRVPANRYTDIGKLTAGDIGALYGLSSARTGDVIAMRGSFDSSVIHKDGAVMEARVPVAASLTYPVDFGILTGGTGVKRFNRIRTRRRMFSSGGGFFRTLAASFLIYSYFLALCHF